MKRRAVQSNRVIALLLSSLAYACADPPASTAAAHARGVASATESIRIRQHIGEPPTALPRGWPRTSPRPTARSVTAGRKETPSLVLRVFVRTQHGPFDDLIAAEAQRWQLDPFLIKGLLANESKLDAIGSGKRRLRQRRGARVVVSGGAVGIAQFTRSGIRAINRLRKHRWLRGDAAAFHFTVRRALTPQEAIPAAAELLAVMIKRYGRDGGITAYNAGGTRGRIVARLGFRRARRAGLLRRSGTIQLQGDRFLPKVLKRTNWYRQQAGLRPLPEPGPVSTTRRYAVHSRPSPFEEI